VSYLARIKVGVVVAKVVYRILPACYDQENNASQLFHHSTKQIVGIFFALEIETNEVLKGRCNECALIPFVGSDCPYQLTTYSQLPILYCGCCICFVHFIHTPRPSIGKRELLPFYIEVNIYIKLTLCLHKVKKSIYYFPIFALNLSSFACLSFAAISSLSFLIASSFAACFSILSKMTSL